MQRLLTLDSARPQASVPFIMVLWLTYVLPSGPVVKYPTVGCIKINLAHLCGQVKCLTVAHFACALE
jgi:hypothetical protein